MHKKGYLPEDKKKDPLISRKSGKGRRLIILHAIAEDGPLVEYDTDTDRPLDDLEWNKDTPHPKIREDGKVTAELLWVA